MKKGVIAILVILLVAAGVILPTGYFGQVAESTLRSRMANMPYGFQMELVDYQRGWFSSTARLQWHPLGGLRLPAMPSLPPLEGAEVMDAPPPLAALASEPVAIDIEIAHGPVYFSVGPGVGLFHARGRVDLGGQPPAGERESPGNTMQLYVSSFSGGTVNSRLEIPAGEWEFGPMTMQLAGAMLEGVWTGPDSFQLQHAALDSMEMTVGVDETAARIAISGVDSRTEYPEGLESGAILAPSESVSSIAEVRVAVSGGNTVLRMTGLHSVDTSSLDEDDGYRIDSEATIESLEVLGREFAPLEFQQTAGGFSEGALLELLTALGGGDFVTPATPQASGGDSQAAPEDPPSAPPAAGMPQFSQEMKEALRALLADGPYADIGAVLTYGGEHTLRFDLRYAFDPERVPDSAESVSLPGIVSGLEYALNAEIPIAAANELLGQGIIQMGLMQGLLQQTETAYTVSVALGNGMLSINGRPMPIPLPGSAPPGVPPEASPTVPPEALPN